MTAALGRCFITVLFLFIVVYIPSPSLMSNQVSVGFSASNSMFLQGGFNLLHLSSGSLGDLQAGSNLLHLSGGSLDDLQAGSNLLHLSIDSLGDSPLCHPDVGINVTYCSWCCLNGTTQYLGWYFVEGAFLLSTACY